MNQAINVTTDAAVLAVEQHYRQQTRRKLSILSGLALLSVVLFCTDIVVGSQGLSLQQVFQGLFSPQEYRREAVIVWQIRMPGAVMALLIGMALALAGAQMQTVLNNPLADPFTLGLASAAGFGASLAIVLGKSLVSYLPLPESWFVAINAFTFALLTALLISSAGRMRSVTPETITLLGIALMFAFNAMLTMMEYIASADQLQELVFWMMGSLAKASWDNIQVLSVTLLLITPLLLMNAWKLTAVRASEALAQARGISTKRLRIQVLVLTSLLTAMAVSFVGTIGFIGLVAPHTARLLIGEEQRWFMPATLLVGAALMSATSLASKTIIPGVILPIGVITALVGVPFFFSLIIKRQRAV